MLDTGYPEIHLGVISRNIQHPESSIQDHVIVPMTFIKNTLIARKPFTQNNGKYSQEVTPHD